MKINVEFSSLADMANFTKFINDSLVPPTQKQVTVADFTLLASELDDLATHDELLFAELIKHRPVIRRMAELNGLIKGGQK